MWKSTEVQISNEGPVTQISRLVQGPTKDTSKYLGEPWGGLGSCWGVLLKYLQGCKEEQYVQYRHGRTIGPLLASAQDGFLKRNQIRRVLQRLGEATPSVDQAVSGSILMTGAAKGSSNSTWASKIPL